MSICVVRGVLSEPAEFLQGLNHNPRDRYCNEGHDCANYELKRQQSEPGGEGYGRRPEKCADAVPEPRWTMAIQPLCVDGGRWQCHHRAEEAQGIQVTSVECQSPVHQAGGDQPCSEEARPQQIQLRGRNPCEVT